MKHHYFESIENTSLPDVIKASFNDSFEKAHLRRLENIFYIILNYPMEGLERYVICLRVEDNTLAMYAPYKLQDNLQGLHTIPDVLMNMVNQYEMRALLID